MLFKRKVNVPEELLKELNKIKNDNKKIKYIAAINFDTLKDVFVEEDCVTLDNREIYDEISNIKLSKSFKDLLFEYIDRTGKSDSYIYNKAKVNRKVFSKIRNEYHKNVSKKTAISLGLALELNIDEFEELLKANGDVLADNNHFDVAIRWFVNNKIYDIDKINDILYECKIELI